MEGRRIVYRGKAGCVEWENGELRLEEGGKAREDEIEGGEKGLLWGWM